MKPHFSAIIIASTLLTAACNTGGGGQNTATHTLDTTAVRYGREQAIKLMQADPDTLAMRRILLDTRASETRLRQEGLHDSADDYIKGFEDHIRANSPSLAAEILN